MYRQTSLPKQCGKCGIIQEMNKHGQMLWPEPWAAYLSRWDIPEGNERCPECLEKEKKK